jgi:hypothetical protein
MQIGLITLRIEVALRQCRNGICRMWLQIIHGCGWLGKECTGRCTSYMCDVLPISNPKFARAWPLQQEVAVVENEPTEKEEIVGHQMGFADVSYWFYHSSSNLHGVISEMFDELQREPAIHVCL